MEDAATAEISRAQIWQWIKYETELEGGIIATPKFFHRALGGRDGAGERRDR